MEDNITNKMDAQLKKAANAMQYKAPNDAWDDIYIALHPKKKRPIVLWMVAATLMLIFSTAMLLNFWSNKRVKDDKTIIVKNANVEPSLNEHIDHAENKIEDKKEQQPILNNTVENQMEKKGNFEAIAQNLNNNKKLIKGNGIKTNKTELVEVKNYKTNDFKKVKYAKKIEIANTNALINNEAIAFNNFNISRQGFELDNSKINNEFSIVFNPINIMPTKSEPTINKPNSPIKLKKYRNKNFDFYASFAFKGLQVNAKEGLVSGLQKSLEDRSQSTFNNSSLLAASNRADLKTNNNLITKNGYQVEAGFTAKYNKLKRLKPYVGLQIAYGKWQNEAFQHSNAEALNINGNNLTFDNTISGKANYGSKPVVPLHGNVQTINSTAMFINLPIGIQYLLNKSKSIIQPNDRLFIDLSLAPSIFIDDNIFYHDNATERYFKLSSVSKRVQLQAGVGLVYYFGNKNQFGIGASANTYLFNINKSINYIQPLQLNNLGINTQIKF